MSPLRITKLVLFATFVHFPLGGSCSFLFIALTFSPSGPKEKNYIWKGKTRMTPNFATWRPTLATFNVTIEKLDGRNKMSLWRKVLASLRALKKEGDGAYNALRIAEQRDLTR
jgi:hypothetical protein